MSPMRTAVALAATSLLIIAVGRSRAGAPIFPPPQPLSDARQTDTGIIPPAPVQPADDDLWQRAS